MQTAIQKFIEAANARIDVSRCLYAGNKFIVVMRDESERDIPYKVDDKRTFGQILDYALGEEPDEGRRAAAWHLWREELFGLTWIDA